MSDNRQAWRSEVVRMDGWELMTARRGTEEVKRIYIEGDGRAFVDRNTPSGDPTPLNPMALKLAMRDARSGVMYVARPCQWVRGPQCGDRMLWTDKRFTQDVVDRYVDLVARETQGQPVELVGYSGGAWVALQVAARLENVTRVVTVAGNLMPAWINAQHKVTTIPVVEYPGTRLADLPVVAYMGGGDKVIRPGVVEAYREATGARDVKVVEVPGATHGEGWEDLRIFE